MINEEIARQVIAIEKKGAEFTTKELIKIMKYLSDKGKKNLEKFVEDTKPVTVKSLLKGGKVETLELNNVDYRDLKKELNKHGVKFTIQKDLSTGNNIVFFQAKDLSVMEQAFKKCVNKYTQNSVKRPSVRAKLKNALDKVKDFTQDKSRSKHKEQSL